jgi:protein import protein ZIM17
MLKRQPKQNQKTNISKTSPTSRNKFKQPHHKYKNPLHTNANNISTTSHSQIPLQPRKQKRNNNFHNSSINSLIQITPHVVAQSASYGTQHVLQSNISSLSHIQQQALFNPSSHTASLTKSQHFFSKTSPTQIPPRNFHTSSKKPPHNSLDNPVNIQNAQFFTNVVNKLKSVFSPTDSGHSPPSSQNKSNIGAPLGETFQTSFDKLPHASQQHIQTVMMRFRTFVSERSTGQESPITAEDKANFVAGLSKDEYQSLQYDLSSQEFFQIPKPTKALRGTTAPRRTTLDKNSPDYEEMMKNNRARYHEGELNAKLENRKSKMIKDALESDVYHLDLEDIEGKVQQVEEIQAKYENNPDFDINSLKNASTKGPTELKFVQNPDGTVTFRTVGDDSTQDEQSNKKVQVPVDGKPTAIGQIADPRLLISFICDVCNNRNVKSIPKRSYERGVVLIRCDCDADHLISDNLGWFDDSGGLTIERILKEDKDQKVFKASVLDLNKPVRDKNDIENGKDVGLDIGDDHITAELMNKIEETLAIARKNDEKQPIQFKHFHHQDIMADELKRRFEGTGQLPMLPAPTSKEQKL